MPLSSYLAAALLLFLSHAVPSWPGVRPVLVGRLGKAGFLTLYSLLSLAALALFVRAYRGVENAGVLFVPLDGAAALAVGLMPAAFLLVAGRLATPFGEPASPRAPRGIYRITRFPGSVGLLLWAVLHLQATGDARRVVLFATMAAIALFAIAKNDRVLARAGGDAAAFRRETGILPFSAILAGRQPWPRGEIGWRWPLAGLAVWVLVLTGHAALFGVDPLYWLPAGAFP